MSTKRLLFGVFLLSLFLLIGITSAQEINNITCINQYHHSWMDGVYDICIDGDYAFLASGDDGLYILDISRPDDFRQIGQMVYNDIQCIAYHDGYVYLGALYEGVYIIDVSNPALANEVGFIPGNNILTIKIVDDFLYACFLSDGLKVYSLNNPASPLMASDLSEVGLPYDIAIKGTMAYVARGAHGLKAVDISDLNNPEVTGVYDPSGCQEINGVAVAGDYAFLAAGEGSFEVVNLNTMQREARIDSFSYSFKVKVVGDYAYMSYGNPDCPMAIIDITNPIEPQTVSIYYPPEDMINFVIDDDLVYVADFAHCVRVVDISDNQDPHETYFYNEFGHDMDVRLYQNYALVQQEYRMKVIDIAEMSNPFDVSYFETVEEIIDVYPSNDVAIIAKRSEPNLTAVDLNVPNSLNVIGTFADGYGLTISSVGINGNYMYLDCSQNIKIVDISDPANMYEAGVLETGTYIENLDVSGNYLIYQTSHRYLVLADISNPLAPAILATSLLPYRCHRIRAFDGIFYAFNGRNVIVYDMSNLNYWEPRHTFQIGEEGDFITDLEVRGKYLYVVCNRSGIKVYDNTDITSPQLVGDCLVDGYAWGFCLDGDVAIVAAATNLGFYDLSAIMTDVPDDNVSLPMATTLLSNYPNPFNSSTNIQLALGADSHVELDVFDILGRKVTSLVNQELVAGNHTISWHGIDDSGQPVASGRYYITARVGDKLENSLPVSLLK